MGENNLLLMLLWLGELTISSWILAYGAEHLAKKYGAKFVGRILLSIATTIPEIAIVSYAAYKGSYGIAIGSGLGSNLMMMTLGLAIMLIIATTRLSNDPQKSIDLSTFKNDKILLLTTAIIGLILFIDGYDYIDGFIFTGIFILYTLIALHEMKKENTHKKNNSVQTEIEIKVDKKTMMKAGFAFLIGAIGIIFGAEPFIHSLEGFSIEVGISTVVLAVIISPIAGEMPEKISMMILARKGARGTSIAIANVLGSKILNNTILLSIAIFSAMLAFGFYEKIENTKILWQQFVLVTIVTIIAIIPMFKKQVGLKYGLMLLSLYIISIVLQLLLSQQFE
ncbi:MAG: sodium:calcium antiporter [Nitrososphaeraceae archaeon]